MASFDRREFTVEEGIEVQDQQLAEWEQVLNIESYEKLKKHMKSTNHLAKTGYDIDRGTSMYEYIMNHIVVRQPFELKS